MKASEAAADRLTMFVDAVIAIALTLLALELPIPTGDTTNAMLSSALGHGKEYLAFALSFTVIAAHWRAHHEIFRYVDTLSGRLTSLTLVWLFMQVLMPFATRVLTAEGAFPPRFSLYALVQVLASTTFALIVREARRGRLYRTDFAPLEFGQSQVRSLCLAGVFAVSVPVSFLVDGSGAYLCWPAAPVVLAVARRVQDRSVHAPGESS
ncbi:TMEM175 family protein [Amycolatopsis sp. OK19-0408]|uniref:TMEM175 family protein n=1 Tax=Amycolatopsis iheyensis TaxID=2945988 RepID=A0A9X2N8K8_9PSEU|nr:TMEM175 family protein [Amycolatopsis iheyensis]MCR6482893.1 TMEM175 family protein [Amycolatopsis iheyensis]